MRLYELASNYEKVLQLITEEDGDVYLDTLEAIQDTIDVKVENIVHMMKNFEAEEKAYAEESKRLADKASKMKNRREGLKNYLEHCLRSAGIEKLKTGVHNLSFAKNPPSVEIDNEDKVPAQYRRPQPDKIDRKAIIDDLKNGVDLGEGIRLVQKTSLRIK